MGGMRDGLLTQVVAEFQSTVVDHWYVHNMHMVGIRRLAHRQ
jgi:hypothetical protein